MPQNWLVNVLACGLWLSFSPLALAVPTPTIEIPQSQASGNPSLLKISVGNGTGVNLSFYKVKETIKKIWLDDPSQILVDVDGCLEGISNCDKNTGSSSSSGAGLIHLRRIQKVAIHGLPHTLVTLLTVVTETQTGERKVYQFQVVPSSSSQHTEVVVNPDLNPGNKVSGPITHLQPLAANFMTVNAVRNGIAVAVSKNLLKPSDELYSRLQKFIFYLQQGDEISVAANKAVVSMNLVNKLIAMGRTPPTSPIVPNSNPKPKPSEISKK